MREWKRKWKKMSLKKTYYIMLGGLIGLPIFIIFLASFSILNQQYKEQAIENVKQMQQTVIADLTSDIDELSMRMTTIIYANDYEMLGYAAGTDTKDQREKFRNREELEKMENLYLMPNKEVIALYFLMNDGTDTFLKSYITREKQRVEEMSWYQNALKNKEKVYIGCFDTQSSGELFVGGKKDMFILVGALSPDFTTDKSGKIKMVELYQSSKVAERIKENNRDYLAGKNRLGIARITDEKKNCLFTTVDGEPDEWGKGYTCIKTPVKVYDSTWYIENYIEPEKLTEEFRRVAVVLMLVILLLFVLLSYYSSYFVKSIVKPIQEMNRGLKVVESGQLDVHIKAAGQFEIRSMIHQFNAMVKQLQVFFNEYEDKLKSGRNASYYFREIMAGRMTPGEAAKEYEPFSKDSYTILGVYIYDHSVSGNEQIKIQDLIQEFCKNSRYASRCCSYIENSAQLYLYYRIVEKDYKSGLHQMLQELQRSAEREFGRNLFICEGERCETLKEFQKEADRVKRGMEFRYLFPEDARIESGQVLENEGEPVLEASNKLEILVRYAFLADEKNLVFEREKLFEEIRTLTLAEIQKLAKGIVISAGKRAEQNNDTIAGIFGKQYNYSEKIDHIQDVRSIRMWITNFMNWLLNYAASKLDVAENDMIILAKRYLQDHYDNPDLTLSEVAEHVGLNEKYFSNRFTKEAGETVSAYLTGIRMQKAKEILKTT